jgi:Protein of unknown function (DUF3349)
MNPIFPDEHGHCLGKNKGPVLAQNDDGQGVAVALSRLLARIVAYLRAGYPEGVPANDYIALLALLRRRLSDDEVLAVATELMSAAPTPIEGTDVRVAITKLTDGLPSAEDTGRVERRLIAAGWPVTDSLGFLG